MLMKLFCLLTLEVMKPNENDAVVVAENNAVGVAMKPNTNAIDAVVVAESGAVAMKPNANNAVVVDKSNANNKRGVKE